MATQVDKVISTSRLGLDGGKTKNKALAFRRTAMVVARGVTLHLVEDRDGVYTSKYGAEYTL